jgi:hypothetical protein
MKRAKIIVTIVLIVLILGAISLTLKPNKPYNPKSCETKEDCALTYNMFYEGSCTAGCFNKNAKTDISCNKTMVWEAFSPGTKCDCIENICQKLEYKCPNSHYVDCMPITTPEADPECYGEYKAWIIANCNVTFAV